MQNLYGIDIIKNNKKLHGLFITSDNGNIKGIFQLNKNHYEKFIGKMNEDEITIVAQNQTLNLLFKEKRINQEELKRSLLNPNNNYEIPEISTYQKEDYKVEIIHKNNKKTYYDPDLIKNHYQLLMDNFNKEDTKILLLNL